MNKRFSFPSTQYVSIRVYPIRVYTNRKTKTKNTVQSLYKCRACKRQFTATVGTIFEDSKIPLNKWFAAIYLMCASKKGISSHQLHRMLDITYPSALFMTHRWKSSDFGRRPVMLISKILGVGWRPSSPPSRRLNSKLSVIPPASLCL